MENILLMNTRTRPLVRDFVGRSLRLFLQPTRFFREDFPRLDLNQALAFGITNAWLGATAGFFVQTLNGLFFLRLFDHWSLDLLPDDTFFGANGHAFLWTAGFLILAPFFLCLRILLSTTVVFLFTQLLAGEDEVGPDPVVFSNVMRIQSVSVAGHWFRLVPVFGPVLSLLAGIILTVTGLRERFTLSTRRATAIVLAPYVLLFFAALAMVAFLIFAFSQIPFQELIDPSDFGY